MLALVFVNYAMNQKWIIAVSRLYIPLKVPGQFHLPYEKNVQKIPKWEYNLNFGI